MKRLPAFFVTILLCLGVLLAHAQSNGNGESDEYNLFLSVLAVAFFSVMIGAAVAGSIAVTALLVTLFLMVSAGILSTGILVGVYKRSLMAGFKTALLIACSAAGFFFGGAGLYLANRVFHLHLKTSIAFSAGSFGGLIGGLLLAFAASAIIRLLLVYFRRKLSF